MTNFSSRRRGLFVSRTGTALHVVPMTQPAEDDDWLAQFHAGHARVLEACYREQFATVERAVGRVLRGADKETVVHEVFLRLISSETVRRGYRGGSLASWLSVLARNQAIDHARRSAKEQAHALREDEAAEDSVHDAIEARQLVEQFQRELPAKWLGVFQQRFLAQRDQREAAKALGISRTTLAYQEMRVRALLKRFLLRTETP